MPEIKNLRWRKGFLIHSGKIEAAFFIARLLVLFGHSRPSMISTETSEADFTFSIASENSLRPAEACYSFSPSLKGAAAERFRHLVLDVSLWFNNSLMRWICSFLLNCTSSSGIGRLTWVSHVQKYPKSKNMPPTIYGFFVIWKQPLNSCQRGWPPKR